MSANFCLQPYHIGERLLACFLNQNKEMLPLGSSKTLQAFVITCPDFDFETLEGTQCFRGSTEMGRNVLC